MKSSGSCGVVFRKVGVILSIHRYAEFSLGTARCEGLCKTHAGTLCFSSCPMEVMALSVAVRLQSVAREM